MTINKDDNSVTLSFGKYQIRSYNKYIEENDLQYISWLGNMNLAAQQLFTEYCSYYHVSNGIFVRSKK